MNTFHAFYQQLYIPKKKLFTDNSFVDITGISLKERFEKYLVATGHIKNLFSAEFIDNKLTYRKTQWGNTAQEAILNLAHFCVNATILAFVFYRLEGAQEIIKNYTKEDGTIEFISINCILLQEIASDERKFCDLSINYKLENNTCYIVGEYRSNSGMIVHKTFWKPKPKNLSDI